MQTDLIYPTRRQRLRIEAQSKTGEICAAATLSLQANSMLLLQAAFQPQLQAVERANSSWLISSLLARGKAYSVKGTDLLEGREREESQRAQRIAATGW